MIIYWLLTQWNSFIRFRHIAIPLCHKLYTVYLVHTEMSSDQRFNLNNDSVVLHPKTHED